MAYPLPRDSEKLALVTKPMMALSAAGIFDSYEVRSEKSRYPRVEITDQ